MRSIIFDEHSVAAILKGHKTQTRRVLKGAFDLGELRPHLTDPLEPHNSVRVFRNMYGNVGDLLYVKEPYWRKGDLTSYSQPKARGWEKRNPMFMPKELSRLTLRITEHRLEHLHDISDDDIIAEGITFHEGTTMFEGKLRDLWRERWDAINAKRGFGWDKNPVVRVIGFEVRS